MAKKGSIPWNKGLSKETDVRVKNYSETKSKNQTGQPSKKRKYSFDPADWVNTCVKCGKVQIYKSRESYKNSLGRIAKNGEYKCCVCSADYQCSEKTQKKKDRLNFLNSLTPEERKQEISNAIKIILKKRYETVSDEWRQERNEKIRRARLDMDPARKQEIYKIVSEKNRENMLDDSGNFIFRPGYNRDTIVYIETVLNEKYNTKFVHAETEKGEFKIYDKEMQRFYYADAYCPKLNLWIEFDEPQKFKNGKLPEEHYIRESRIKSLIENVTIERIYFDRKQFK
jgi:hypothetical protein